MITLVVLGVALAAGVVGFLFGRRRPSDVDRGPLVDQPRVVEPSPESRSRRDIERALADLRLGVVVVGDDGSETYRNNQAERFATGRHGDALVEAALQRVVEGAMLGLSLEESVEVYGPPARSVLVQASPTYDGGSVAGAVAVIDDVTQARQIDRVRSDFVANVSHELRTPVGAMSVLAETIADSDDPEVIDRLSSRMQREANRLGNTIEDLLALSRLETGPVSDPETIDLVSVASMAIERTAEAAQQRNVRVELNNDACGPVLIDGDSGQLVSAVSNLVDNGIKYSDPGGDVVVKIAIGLDSDPEVDDRPEAAARSSDGPVPMAVLSVIDQGIGIPDRDLDRIFERFYRVDTARSRDTGGTGLGLSIVRHALLNHGGRVEVFSQEGEGTTFVLTLELSAAQERLGPPEGASTTETGDIDASVDANGVNDG